MIKSLILSVMLSSSVGVCASQPVCAAQPQQQNVNRSYKQGDTLYYGEPMYDTNDINSFNDFVVNNAYHFECIDNSLDNSENWNFSISGYFLFIYQFSFIEQDTFIDEVYYNELVLSNNYVNFSLLYEGTFMLYFYFPTDETYVGICIDDNSRNDAFIFSFDFVLTYVDYGGHDYSALWFSKCENIPLKYEPIPTSNSNLYTLLYDWYYGLFNNTGLSAVTTTTGLTMTQWLSHTLTILTLVTFVVILFFFLKWLFKVVSGLILLKN